MKPYHEMTEEERLEFGREVANDPTSHGFMRQGRPITNVEMNAYTLWMRDQRRKANELLRDL